MPGKRISALTPGGAARLTDLLPVARGAANVSLNVGAIAALGSGVTTFNGRNGPVTLSNADVLSALGFVPLGPNLSGEVTSVADVTTFTQRTGTGSIVMVSESPFTTGLLTTDNIAANGTASITKNSNNGVINQALLIDGGTQNITTLGSAQTIGFRGSGAAYFGAIGGYGNGTVTGIGLWGGANTGVPHAHVTGVGAFFNVQLQRGGNPEVPQNGGSPVNPTITSASFKDGSVASPDTGATLARPMFYLERHTNNSDTSHYSDWANVRLQPSLLVETILYASEYGNSTGIAARTYTTTKRPVDVGGEVAQPLTAFQGLAQSNAPAGQKNRDIFAMGLVAAFSTGTVPDQFVGMEIDMLPSVSASASVPGSAAGLGGIGLLVQTDGVDGVGTRHSSNCGVLITNSTTGIGGGWQYGQALIADFYQWALYLDNTQNDFTARGIKVNTAFTGAGSSIVQIFSGNAERARFSSDGLFSIGGLAPTHRLTVQSDAVASPGMALMGSLDPDFRLYGGVDQTGPSYGFLRAQHEGLGPIPLVLNNLGSAVGVNIIPSAGNDFEVGVASTAQDLQDAVINGGLSAATKASWGFPGSGTNFILAIGNTDPTAATTYQAVVFEPDLWIERTTTGPVLCAVENDGGAGTSHSIFSAETAAAGGDCYLRLGTGGAHEWAFGMDRSASKAWVLSRSNVVGTNNVVSVDQTTGAFTHVTPVNLGAIETALTAHAGGGQASALQLLSTKTVHNVSTVGTAADSVKLPSATGSGAMHFVKNSAAANSMQLFGTSPDTIDGVATGTGVAVAAGKGRLLIDAAAGNWISVAGA